MDQRVFIDVKVTKEEQYFLRILRRMGEGDVLKITKMAYKSPWSFDIRLETGERLRKLT